MALETMTILTQDRIEGMNAKGIWPKGLLLDRVSRTVETQPDAVAVTGINSMRDGIEAVL